MGKRVDRLPAVAEGFRCDSRNLFRSSPFYREIAGRAAGDARLQELAAGAGPGQSPTLMLFAGVHFLVLRGASHPLAEIYRGLARGRAPGADPYPAFHDFCVEHAAELGSIIATRRVQTNEIGRSVYIRFAMDRLAAERGSAPLSVVELGASAGLNLAWDRYRIRFFGSGPAEGPEERWAGDPDSPVRLECEVRGGPVSAASGAPEHRVEERMGIELHPPDLRSPDDVRWLAAFIWPDQPARMERLRAAIALAAEGGWPLVRADASEALVSACASLSRHTVLALVHTVFAHQLAPRQRDRLESQVLELARSRDLIRVAVEERDGGTLELSISDYSGGRARSERVLGLCHPHGAFIDCRE